MTTEKDTQSWLAFWTVLTGIGVLMIVFITTIYAFKDTENPAESIVAVLGAVTGILGTLVGYIAGQAGKEKADHRATQAERQLTAVVGEGGKDILKEAQAKYPHLFE